MHFLEFLLLLGIEVSSAFLADAISGSFKLNFMHGVPSGSEVFVARGVAEVQAGRVGGEKEESRANEAAIAHDACVTHVQTALPLIIDGEQVALRYIHKEAACQAESDERVKRC